MPRVVLTSEPTTPTLVVSKPSIIGRSEELMSIYQLLLKKGVRQKEMAKAIGMYPSAFSVMMNNVVVQICEISNYKNADEAVANIFKNVNNVSEKKYRRHLKSNIDILRSMTVASETTQENNQTYINTLIEQSPMEHMKKIEGIHSCYYVSSFGYRLKKEPLMLRYNEQRGLLEAFKGNKLSPASYRGFAYLSNSNLLSIHLQEQGTMVPDNFLINCHLPPSYDQSLQMLKGIGVSMSNSFHPISRKIIIEKDTENEDYEQIETVFYEEDSAPSDNDTIKKYLTNDNSYLEYFPIPRPMYDRSDLDKEIRIAQLA